MMESIAASSQQKPYLRIFEQPAEKLYRFRYKSEGRLNSSIPGANSTQQKPTYPSIELGNFVGVAEIHISCVTDNDNPPRQHPHHLISGKGGNESILKVQVNHKKLVVLKDIGIVCVKKEEIVKSLDHKRKKNIDPTNGGWNHMSSPYTSIDLRRVRLCFDVRYAENDNNWKHLGHVISQVIVDKKSNGQLKIVDISSNRSSVNGGKRIILLCDKVKREDISVVFYEEDNDRKVIWREEINYKNSTSMRVHHQYAISFQTPEYKDVDIYQSRKAFIQLYRPSDTEVGDPVDFEFIPNPQSTRLIHKKKKRISERSREILESIAHLKKAEKLKYSQGNNDAETINKNNETTANPQLLVDIGQDVKKEDQHLLDNSIQNQFQSSINGSQNSQRPTCANVNLFDEPYDSYQNNFPQYYYNSYTQANSYFGEAPHISYSPGHILIPSTSSKSYQQPQSHQVQPQQSTSSSAMNTFRNEYNRYFDQPTTSTAVPTTSNNTNLSASNNVNDLLTINDSNFSEFDSNLFDIDTDINNISENLDSMKISTCDN